MRFVIEKIKELAEVSFKTGDPRVLGPSDNFISLQRLNKSMVKSSKNLLSLVLWDGMYTPLLRLENQHQPGDGSGL